MGFRYVHGLLLAAFCMTVLSGCAVTTLSTATNHIFQRTEVNLIEKNYAAADYLVQQAKAFVRSDDLVKAIALNDAQEPEMSSTIGKLIPEQVGIRLAQLGYRMDLEDVLTTEDPNFLRPVMHKEEKPDYVLHGTYMRERKDLKVNLRIVDAENGRVIAVFDYAIPVNKKISEMSEPHTRIFRVSN